MAKLERRHFKMGRPRDIKAIDDHDSPDNYPSLIKYLEAKGKIKHNTYALMLKARNMYLTGSSVDAVAKHLSIDINIVDRWVLLFSWSEERDRRLFEKFKSITGASQFLAEDLNRKHDKIAGSIEQVVERFLQRTSDGKETLTPKELSSITSILKATQEIRNTARGVTKKGNSAELNVNVRIPAAMEKVASAMVDAFERPKLAKYKTRTIAVGTEDQITQDVELEETSDGFAETRNNQKLQN